MRNGLLALTFLLFSTTLTLAQTIPDYSDKYVNDFAGVFSSAQVSQLRSLFSDVEQQTTAELTILTVDTVSPMAMSQYAQEVADKWKIGKADTDNGLLILYAKDTRKIWVQTGYGLEGILPDSKVGSILDDTFVPARAANDSAGGMVLAAHQYAQVVTDNADEVRSGNAGPEFNLFAALIAALVAFGLPVLFLAWVFYASYNSKHPKCECGGRSDAIKTETIKEEKTGPFGKKFTAYYALVTYRCRKCGKKFKKKQSGSYGRGGVFVAAGGFHGGGGFGGGGFGGGGFGGGGAGR